MVASVQRLREPLQLELLWTLVVKLLLELVRALLWELLREASPHAQPVVHQRLLVLLLLLHCRDLGQHLPP